MIDPNTLIQNDLVLHNLKADSKDSAIEQLIRHLYKLRPQTFGAVALDEAIRAVLEREAMQTTGVGNYVAFPHGRIHGWGAFAVIVGISKKGLEFHSVDDNPAHVICLMISSEKEPYMILKVMASFSRLFHSVSHPLDLFKGKNPAEMMVKWQKSEAKSEKWIIAHDLMRPIRAAVSPSTPVEDAARSMHLHHLDVLPVVDDENKFYGVISCLDISLYGIPDFFKQLYTVSFVRHIDPFEKYYKIRKDLKVKDLIKRDLSSAISKENTLIEIIFQLTVKQHSQLFILDNGILIGEIDRFSIVDKILFY